MFELDAHPNYPAPPPVVPSQTPGSALCEHLAMRRKQCGWVRRLSRLTAVTTVLSATALAGALALTAGPAYADITSSDYTIGMPPSSMVASPSTVASGASTNFEIDLTLETSLAGSAGDSITITPSEALGSAPTNIALISASCDQSGTAGGGGAGSSATSG
jgi:hypothetical protein